MTVRVQPRASRAGLKGFFGDTIKVAVTAPPVEGQANAACIALLSKLAGVARSDVKVQRGASSRDKVIFFRGITCEKLAARLLPHLPDGEKG